VTHRLSGGNLRRLGLRFRRRFLSRSSWAPRPPLIYLSFYLELPFDAGLTDGHALRKLHLSEGPLEEWADLDLDGLLGMDPRQSMRSPPLRCCTTTSAWHWPLTH